MCGGLELRVGSLERDGVDIIDLLCKRYIKKCFMSQVNKTSCNVGLMRRVCTREISYVNVMMDKQ